MAVDYQAVLLRNGSVNYGSRAVYRHLNRDNTYGVWYTTVLVVLTITWSKRANEHFRNISLQVAYR